MRRPLAAILALLVCACSPPAPQPEKLEIGNPPRVRQPDCKPASGPPKPFADPAAAARQAAAAGDYRVFKVTGFAYHEVPEIFCPAEVGYELQSRGGIVTSDTPDFCGTHSRADITRPDMAAYNRALAESSSFEKATGCRAATYCEEAYDKDGSISRDKAKFDPRCPRSQNLLLATIRFGTSEDLKKAIAAGALKTLDRSSPIRDPARAAVISNRLDNLKILVAAGEDPGRDHLVSDAAGAASSQVDVRPLIAYLVSKGADPTGGCAPGLEGHSSLQMAVISPSPELFDWLMANGADPAKSFEACSSVTAIAQALNGAMMYAPSPDSDRRGAIQRRMAIRMIQRGGVAKGANPIDMLRRKDTRTLSVLIAAWRREGNEATMLAMMRANAQDPKLAEALAWVDKVEACKRKVVEFVDDRARLCAGWP